MARAPPRRGGEHPTYGIYIGGSFLDDQYRLTGNRHYQYTSQRRSANVVSSIEQALLTTIESKTAPKFNGNLEKTPSSSEFELEKLTFIKQLKRKVQRHGQQTFYAAFYQNEVVSLFEHYHKFTVEEIIDQYELRCSEPPPELDPTTGDEIEESRQLQFESYDEYEFNDIGLSRLVVESMLTPSLQERMFTKFGNNDNYETYPGQILFMMALDTCNASVQRDIAGAQTKFDNSSLDAYPGEDITELATEALRLINILSGSYALPINLGSKLIKKVTGTSSEFFNRKMYALLDSTRTLETSYRLKDPVPMGDDPAYTNVGPYAICAALQEEHGRLIADSDWPALATKLPESNAVTTEETMDTPPKQFQCFKCKQWGHKANDPACPLFSKKPSPKPTQESSSDRRLNPKDPWKYIKPKDLTKPVIIDDKEWYFCTKCRCQTTGKTGFYQLLHTDATHDPNWTRAPESNATQIADPDPTPPPPRQPSSEFADDDDLVFTGVHLFPVIQTWGTNDGANDTAVQRKEPIDLELERKEQQRRRLHVINTLSNNNKVGKAMEQQKNLSVNFVFSENNMRQPGSTSQCRTEKLYSLTTGLWGLTLVSWLTCVSGIRTWMSSSWNVLRSTFGSTNQYIWS